VTVAVDVGLLAALSAMAKSSGDMKDKSSPSVGIAFGGGAARGFAHIGVLEALSESGDERLMPQFVAGTSTGSIMGALYAGGLSVETMKAVSEEMGWLREVVDVAQSIRAGLHNLTGLLLPGSLEKWIKDAMGVEFDQSRGGFLSSNGLGNWVSRLLHPKESFEDLDRKLAIVATEIEKGERVVFTSHDLIDTVEQCLTAHTNRFMRTRVLDNCSSVATAVRASSAIPVVFEAVREQGLCLADGGILDQVPVEIARAMGADIVIGVSLGFVQFYEKPAHPHESLMNLLELMSREGIARSLSMADIAVEMPGIEKTSLMDMEQRETLIALGKTAMKARLGDLIREVEEWECSDREA
jgi:NTE family protein